MGFLIKGEIQNYDAELQDTNLIEWYIISYFYTFFCRNNIISTSRYSV